MKTGLDVTLPGFDGDPTTVNWQTKTFRHPRMETYKITCDGRLYEEVAEYEHVPEEERPKYNKEVEGFEKDFHQLFGMTRKVTMGWRDTEFHGILKFHAHIDGDGEGYAYEAKFTDGELIEIARDERW